METAQQFNENFNEKKPKKKGLLIGGIIFALVVVAFVLVYFLVLTNPKFIFSKAIDKLLAVDIESYESVKIDTTMKASVNLEDASYQTELEEIEKLTLKAETQMDIENKQEIVNLGLEYDNQAVIDTQIYYNDGDMYAYFEGLFDKYIELDVDEETKAGLDEIFERATSEENLKNTEKAISIIREELKFQIKEYGKFEKKKDEVEVGKDDVKVTKSILTISEKQLYKILGNMLSNLAKNDEFLDCFESMEDYTEESTKDLLKEAANEIKDLEGSSKNNLKISLYTKGLLNNKLVAVDIEIYSENDESTSVLKIVKEEEVYSYNGFIKENKQKTEVINGRVEIEKDKDTKKEKSGKIIITAEIDEIGSANLEIDYSVEYDQGIDKINTSNSVNMEDLTETDIQDVMTKLMERPLIGDVISNLINTNIEDDFLVDPATGTENMITTSQNEVKDDYYGYSVTYSVPEEFKYEEEYSYDYSKYYKLEDADYSYIEANVSLGWQTETEYIEDDINWDYDYYSEETDYYKNVNLSEVKSVAVGDKTFKYVILSYESNFGYGSESKYQNVYVWYPLGEEHIFTIEFEATDKVVTEDIIKGFLDINVTELN